MYSFFVIVIMIRLEIILCWIHERYNMYNVYMKFIFINTLVLYRNNNYYTIFILIFKLWLGVLNFRYIVNICISLVL